MLLSAIAFVLVLGILVFVHELGHFLVAKWTGMRVDEFALGFPPRLYGKKVGETTYAVNLLPLGGYVKIHGENGQVDGGDDEPRAFNRKPVWARSLVLVAGVTMNLAFAFVVLCVAYTAGFPAISPDTDAIPGATVTNTQVLVSGVLKDSAADKAGIQPADEIVSVGETAVSSSDSLKDATVSRQRAGRLAVTVTVRREGKELALPATLAASGTPLGVEIVDAESVRVPWYRSPQAAVQVIGSVAGSTWDALAEFGRQLFHAKLDRDISGPVGIYRATSSAVREGFESVVFLSVALSVNLALLNILPIPVLDGGKLLFVFIEGAFRKRVIAVEVENAISTIAFFLLIALIAVITLKDVGLL